MTDHRFEAHEPVVLYVELSSGSTDMTSTDTTESPGDITGRQANEVDVTLEDRDLRGVEPRRRTGFLSDDPSPFRHHHRPDCQRPRCTHRQRRPRRDR